MLKLAVGSALLLTVVQGWALTLGATQGAVIIGRPLDIQVQSSLDASHSVSNLCLLAQVAYGERALQPQAISVAIERLGADGRGWLRIRATEPVTEPLVTLVVQAGCQQTFRRSYTLLADLDALPRPTLAPDVAVVAPVVAAAAVAVAPGRTRLSAPPAPVADVPPPTPIRLSEPAPRPAGVRALRSKVRPSALLPRADEAATPGAAVSGAVQMGVPEAPVAAGGARLQLDPLDLPAVPVDPQAPADALDAATTAPADAVADAQGQAEAARLAQEVEQLRGQQVALSQSLAATQAQLAQAQAERYHNPVVYGLGAAVLALLAGLVVLWRRRAASSSAMALDATPPWWETASPPPTTPAPAPTAHQPAVAAPSVAVAAAAAQLPTLPGHDVDGLEVREAGESLFMEVPIAALAPQELADLWQRLDFFDSLGQHREAIETLKQYLIDHPRSSEAPYLRFLAQANTHGTPEDQQAAQSLYEHHFQRLVPTQQAPGAGLLDDAVALAQLASVWPRLEQAQAWLVRALSSQPGDTATLLHRRTLPVFDDLLMLWGVSDFLAVLPAAPTAPAPVAVPALTAAVTTQTAAQDAPPDVSLDFQTWTSVHDLPPTAPMPLGADAPSPASKESAVVDFDFFQWEPPSQDEKPAGTDTPKEGKQSPPTP